MKVFETIRFGWFGGVFLKTFYGEPTDTGTGTDTGTDTGATGPVARWGDHTPRYCLAAWCDLDHAELGVVLGTKLRTTHYASRHWALGLGLSPQPWAWAWA